MPSLRTAIHSKNFPKPTGAGIVNLKMKDGGQVSPWSLKGMGQSLVNAASNVVTSPAEKRANISLRMPVSEPAPAPAPAPVASQPQAPTQLGGVNTSAIARREAVAGLREGGPVGGKGKGDKVPAMLEPEEFVVSNEMMDDNPSLRGALHEMRAETLAKKGMTPAEADAKSLRGPVVHALHGQEIPGMITSEAPMTGDEAALFGKYKPPPVNAQGVPASAAPMTSAAPKAPMNMDPTAGSLIRDKMLGSAKDWKGTVDTLTKEHSLPGAKLAGTALKAVAAPLSAYQTYQDIGKGEYDDAALHGLDTAAGAALFTPAAPAAGLYLGARGAYEAPEALRGAIGEKGMNTLGGVINQVGQNTGLWGTDNTDGDARVAQMLGNGQTATPANKPSLRLPVNQRGQGYLDPRRTDVNPADPRLGQSRDFSNELNGAKAPLPSDLREGVVHKTVDAQGRVTYSGRNVGVNGNGETQMVDGKGRDLKMLNGNNSSYTYSVGADGKRNGPTVSAFSDGQTGSTLTTDGGISLRGSQGGGNALHGARMDAAKRGDWGAVNASLAAQGQAPVKGTDTGGGGGSPRDMIMDRLRGAGKLSVAGMKLAQDLTNSDNQLRGHQMQYNSSMTGHDIAREGHQLTSANNKARLQYDINKDHRDYTTGRSDKAFEHQQKGAEAFEKNLTSLYPGEDGKGDQKQIAVHRQMATNYVNDLVQTLTKAGDHQAAAELAQAGPGALHTNHQAEIAMAMRTRAALEKANGWIPTTGGFKDSTHPNAWKPIGYEKRPVGGDHVLFPNGHISVNDMRGTSFYNQTGGTSDFDQLIADAQKAEAKRKGAK